MKKFLRGKRRLLFIGTFFVAITFLAVPVMAAKISPAEKLRKAEELSSKASEMAVKAKESYNVALAKKALELANQATYLVLEAVAEAQRKADPALAQAAINTANSVMKAITQIINTATFISQISTDPKTIADTKEILEKANKAKELNNKAIQTARILVVKPGPPEGKPPEEIPVIPPPGTETTEQERYQEEASPSQ